MNERSIDPLPHMSSPAKGATDIREAARRLFAHRGYAGTSMRAIAEAAGVSLGLAYNYFSGKEALLRSVVEEGRDRISASLDVLETNGSPEECLRRFVRASLEAVRDDREFWQVIYGLRHQSEVAAALQDELDAIRDDILARLRYALVAVGDDDPAVAARLLFAAIDGAGQHYVRDPEGYPLEAVAERIADRFVTSDA